MPKAFTPLDNILFQKLFQPMSDMAAQRMGIGRGSAACLCLDLASLSWIVSRTTGLSGAISHGARDNGVAFLDLSLLLLGLAAFISLRIMFRRSATAQANPSRLSMRPHRAVVLLMLGARLMQLRALNFADAGDIAMLMFATSALYLGACTEPPPVRRIWPSLLAARA